MFVARGVRKTDDHQRPLLRLLCYFIGPWLAVTYFLCSISFDDERIAYHFQSSKIQILVTWAALRCTPGITQAAKSLWRLGAKSKDLQEQLKQSGAIKELVAFLFAFLVGHYCLCRNTLIPPIVNWRYVIGFVWFIWPIFVWSSIVAFFRGDQVRGME